MSKNYVVRLCIAAIAVLMTMPGYAIDYWTVGKVQAVLAGGEETAAAGLIYVSAEPVENAEDIAPVPSMMQTNPVLLSGTAGSSAINKEYHFYAKANEGYTFVGFASTATSTPSGTGLAEGMATVGDYSYYTSKAGAGWSSNTEETAKVFTRYAVFQKNDTGNDDNDNNGENGGEQDTATVARVVSVTNQFGKNLVNAVLTVNEGGNFEDGDVVTHIYVTFDHELAPINGMAAHKALAQAVSLVNTTTGRVLEFNQYSCGLKGDDKTTLDLFLSTENYINSKDYKGVYMMTLPAAIDTTKSGIPTQAYRFTFTYGDSYVEQEEPVNFDEYVGNWKQVSEQGETQENPGTFSFEKIGDAYYITNLYASTLQIPLSSSNGKFYFANTQDEHYQFVSATDERVEALFMSKNNQKEIYLGQFSLLSDRLAEPIVGGVCYFIPTTDPIPTGIDTVESRAGEQLVYDLQGRRLSAPVKGINIVNGKKLVIK